MLIITCNGEFKSGRPESTDIFTWFKSKLFEEYESYCLIDPFTSESFNFVSQNLEEFFGF